MVEQTEIAEPAEVVEFWFGEDPDQPLARQDVWWTPNEKFDAEVEERFEPTLRAADQDQLSHWREAAQSTLALVLVFDQFPRNIYRGSARAFGWDERAVALTDYAMREGLDEELRLVQRWFLYLPLMHSESLERQERSVEVFDELRQEAPAGTEIRAALEGAMNFAVEHRDIVAEFGRFPHRNRALGREPTEAESDYLEGDGKRFGQ